MTATARDTLNAWGLVLSSASAALLFFFGVANVLDTDGRSFLVGDNIDPAEKAKARRYTLLSRVALVLLFVGFALQLVAGWPTRWWP